MSKKLEVLQMLREAGDRGVRSDEFYRRFNGRGVARIYDLRHEGHVIKDERDGKYKRYRLTNVGSSTENRDQVERQSSSQDDSRSCQPVDADLGVASGVADSASSLAPAEAPPAAMYDPFEEWAA